ncbi:MAG: transposase, partial [Burkholderia sp.]
AAFHDILQADAYAGFDQLYASGDVHGAACWDHARRKDYDIQASTPPDERLRVRQEKVKPLLATFEATIREKLAPLSIKSMLAKAIHYALNPWAALGRKHYLFVGSVTGGERATAMYRLIVTCKLNGINPRAYLEYVLTHIADYLITRIDGLLPWNGADKLKPAAIPPSTT